LAEANNEVYVKEKNEDFMTLLSGVMGQKKRIHIQIGDVLDTEIDKIKEECSNSNKQIQALAQVIDASIKNYKLWPTNYIAYDILNKLRSIPLYTSEDESLLDAD
jgi:16S rRNA A1518/A1519 N6-dimethyltransferase RsmA/KsgA/DIM1 with predicted DNA glycosylase/AP lyase activity